MCASRPKACSVCWLRRTKCDGGRPCARCARLFIPDCRDRDPAPQNGRGHRQRLGRACPPCATSKVRCDTDRPCRRCIRLGITTRCGEVEPIWCLAVASLLTTPAAQPESLICLLRTAHRIFDRDTVLRNDVQSYCRSLGGRVLKPDDVRFIEREIWSGVAWNEVVPPPVLVSPSSPRDVDWQRPMVIFTAVIPGDGGPTVRIQTPNPSATTLLGYTQQEMAAATADYNSRPHGEFLSTFFKVFHPASWPTLVYSLCRHWMLGTDTVEFGRVTLLRKDARPVDAFATMTIRKQSGCSSPTGPTITVHHIMDIDVIDA